MTKKKRSGTVLVLMLAATALFLAPNRTMAASPIIGCMEDTEESKIKEAVEDLYIRGLKIRDFSLILTLCTSETKLMGAGEDGLLRVTTLERWAKRFDPAKPPFKKLEYEITKIDVVGTIAQVRIDFLVDSKTPITDFLHMVKIEGRWRIVNIIDH